MSSTAAVGRWDDRHARAALSRLGEPGDPRLSRLVAELGATRLLELLAGEQDVRGLRTDVAERLRGLNPARDLERAARMGIRFVCPGDDEWPDALLDGLDSAGAVHRRGGPPVGLWVRGPLRLAEVVSRSVSVVGSRSATTYGADVAGRMAADLASAGTTVVSGAAYGIDVAAHRGALAGGGATVAVLACGVDRAYPVGHRALLDHLGDHALVVSELPPGCAPTKLRFLTRNRLIAALSSGTVVVEAAVRSGALSTAAWATRLGRVVMGVPGPVTSAPSEGVHELLRRGEAHLVTSAAHVRELLSPAGADLVSSPRGGDRPADALSARALQVLDAVPAMQGAGAASIARTAGVGVGEARTTLDDLAARGLVTRFGHAWRLGPTAR